MSTKRKSTPIRLRKKTTREVMLDLTAKYAEAVTKLAALEQRVDTLTMRVDEHCEASHDPDLESRVDKLESQEKVQWREIDRLGTEASGLLNPAPAEERGDVDTTETAEHAAQRFAREATAYAQEIAAIRKAMGAYPDSDLVSLATTLRAQSDALEQERATANAAVNEAQALRQERDQAIAALGEVGRAQGLAQAQRDAALADAARWKERASGLVTARAERTLSDVRAATARGEVETVKGLLRAVTLDEMGGTPDLFGPTEGWEMWNEAASRALSSSPPPATERRHKSDCDLPGCQHSYPLVDGNFRPLRDATPPQPSPEKCDNAWHEDVNHPARSCPTCGSLGDASTPTLPVGCGGTGLHASEIRRLTCTDCYPPKPSQEKGQGEKP